MKDMVISTKNTTNARKKAGMASAIFTIFAGIFVVAFYIYANEYTRSSSVILLLLLGLFLIGDGIVMAVMHYINGSTYVEIYEDRIVGKGIQNTNVLDFNIKLEEISNISAQGFWLHIQTNSGVYKVMTDKNTATKVFNYYITLKG